MTKKTGLRAEIPNAVPDHAHPRGRAASTRDSGTHPCRYQGCRRRALESGLCRVHGEAQLRWQAGGFTDAGPVRRHMLALLDAGLSVRAVRCVTGVDHRCLARLVVGSPETGTWPQGRIPAAAARRILEIPIPVATSAAAPAEVPAVGSIRRLRALVSIGYDAQELLQELGLGERAGWALLAGITRVVEAGTARRIAAAFEERQMRAGSCEVCRGEAARHGWAPPLAWDEHSIDNPAAEPDRGQRRQVFFDELYAELREMGLHQEAIAARMGITIDSLNRQLLRYGMSESGVRS